MGVAEAGAGASTAVVVGRWPLLRIGMRAAAVKAGFSDVVECADLPDALGGPGQPGLVVAGDVEGAGADLRRVAAVAPVVTLVGPATREVLAGLFGAGVLGVALRSSSLEELVDVIRGACRGQRAVVPALVPALVERGGAAATPTPAPGPSAGELTAGERRVLAALAAGASNQEIAEQLYLSPSTVKTHLAHIYAKLGVGGRHEALSRAVALGLVH